jgi:hypothetical protein
MENYYTQEGKFNYIRYNSLPALADHIIDYSPSYYDGWGVQCQHHKPVGLGVVKQYDTIFVNADLLDQCTDTLVNISVPYHLLTGNADKLLNDSTVNRILQTKIVSWSGHNFKKYDERFLQIPMGFTELGDKRPNSFLDYIDLPVEKVIPLVITPFGDTHNSRSDLNNLYGDGILNLRNKISYSHFLTLLSISKYSCCPRGNALDSHRFVESIVCNSIPIVMTSDLDPVYEEMGAIIITDWNVCKNINSLPTPTLNRDMVTLEYWKDRIKLHQQKFESVK